MRKNVFLKQGGELDEAVLQKAVEEGCGFVEFLSSDAPPPPRKTDNRIRISVHVPPAEEGAESNLWEVTTDLVTEFEPRWGKMETSGGHGRIDSLILEFDMSESSTGKGSCFLPGWVRRRAMQTPRAQGFRPPREPAEEDCGNRARAGAQGASE